MSDDILRRQIERFEAFWGDFEAQACTCEDRSYYIAGKYFITKATTNYTECKKCQQENKEDHKEELLDE